MKVYGTSAWDLNLRNAIQFDIVITDEDRPEITVDNIEVAQFIYLLLSNDRVRQVIDAVGKKAVLILGRFTTARKAILDAIREELRRQNYIPILFDFAQPASKDTTETVSTLAHMSRFIIADLTAAKSLPQELTRIVPILPSVPVQPLLLAGSKEWSMFGDLRRYPWVLDTVRYKNLADLLISFQKKIIGQAEAAVQRHRPALVAAPAEDTRPDTVSLQRSTAKDCRPFRSVTCPAVDETRGTAPDDRFPENEVSPCRMSRPENRGRKRPGALRATNLLLVPIDNGKRNPALWSQSLDGTGPVGESERRHCYAEIVKLFANVNTWAVPNTYLSLFNNLRSALALRSDEGLREN